MFAKTGKNDWIDFALFGFGFLIGLAGGLVILSVLGVSGFVTIILSLIAGTAAGLWVIHGEPLDLYEKAKIRKEGD